ncbi:transient receptor potential cation channel subfamily M member 1-like [Amphiura filiformis]|uniref:transient receptor potential cation channel subfamily M member 1-like n=1 Tax=Amphiura filiformis TaxID=82378 RepID=UPI003B21241E
MAEEQTASTEEQNTMASAMASDEQDGNPEQSVIANGLLHGTIIFKNQISKNNRLSNYYRRREFVIVDEDNDIFQTAQYLTKQWQLGEPKLVISLVGGYRGIKHVSSAVKKTFLRDLANAVLSTGAWLTTGGLYSGMTKDVGESLRDYAIGRAMAQNRKVVAIGIMPISVLKEKEELKKATNEVSFFFQYHDVMVDRYSISNMSTGQDMKTGAQRNGVIYLIILIFKSYFIRSTREISLMSAHTE